jgi:hypothetical protein
MLHSVACQGVSRTKASGRMSEYLEPVCCRAPGHSVGLSSPKGADLWTWDIHPPDVADSRSIDAGSSPGQIAEAIALTRESVSMLEWECDDS